MPWFVACCARSPRLRHSAAVAAWHLSVCLGCGRRRASLACLVAPRGALRLVWSSCSGCSGPLSRRRGAFLHPRGLGPRLYWVVARGTRRPAENRAHCACRWPRPRQGRWARSVSYQFRAPRWGCSWRVPPASVLGCVRCGGLRVWTRSLTRSVSRTVCRSTRDSAGAPGLFCVHADTSPCGSEDATPGSRACVRVLVRPGRVWQAGLPGAFWCASPSPAAPFFFSAFIGPLRAGVAPFLVLCLLSPPPLCSPLFFVSFLCCCFPRAPFVFCLLWFPALGALGLGAVCCLSCWLPVRSRLVCVSRQAIGCSLVVAAHLQPPLCLAFFVAPARCLAFFFFFFVSSPHVCAPVFSAFFWSPAPGALGLGAVLCVFFSSCLSALCALSPVLCLPLGRLLLPGGCCPPPPVPFCVSRFSSAWCLVFCFSFFSLFLCAPPLSLAFSDFGPHGALGLGAVFCLFCGPPCCPALRALSPRLCVSLGRLLLPGGCCPPPPFCVLQFSSLPLGAPFFFIFLRCVPPLSLAFSGFRPLVPWASALCVVCFVGLPLLGSPCALASFVLPAWPLAAPWWLLPPSSPLRLVVFVAAARCCVPCAVLCCVSLGALLRRAAARCAARCCAVVRCIVLFASFGAAACCAEPSGAACRLGALCFAALCFAVFPRAVCSMLCVFCRGVVVRAVVRRSALCCVCPGVLCCAFPLLSALCRAVLCCAGALALCCSCGACCCWRLVLWCAAVCCAVSFGVLWCGAWSGGPWLSACGVFRCRCPCLAAWSAFLWLVWFAVVPCFPVSCSVVLCCRVVLCCCALLSCCGAVAACFALLLPVVLCCVVLLVGCASFCPVVVSACCGAFSLVLCVPCLPCRNFPDRTVSELTEFPVSSAEFPRSKRFRTDRVSRVQC